MINEQLYLYAGMVALIILFALMAGVIAYAVNRLALDRRLKQFDPRPDIIAHSDVDVVNRWARNNAWVLQDKALYLEAQAIHMLRLRQKPEESLEENLAHVSAVILRRYGGTYLLGKRS